ncbi:hypothetical protein ACHQM5_019370 [Ranunculus cassubicifolius]
MAIDIFSAKPSSFNLDKNSTFATNLKATITDKLTHYLADYSDDVLAKYIVVLICNGKDQHETRHELEAFLGKESKEFVSWLWNFLLESVDRFRSKRVLHSEDEFGYSGDVDVKKKSRRRRGVRSHAKEDANMLSEDEKVYYPSKSVSSKHKSKGSRCYSRKSKSSLSEINDMYGRRKLLKHAFSKICGPTESDCTGVTKYAPSELDVSSEESSGSERSMLYVKENKQSHMVEQVVPNHSAELPSQPLCLPNDEEHSINLKSIAARGNHIYAPSSEDVAGGTSSTWSIDSVTHPNETLRGSVWDRLGRQCNDDRIVRGGRLTGEVPFCDDGIDADTDRRLEHDSKRICIPHHADEINRKRQFTVISVEECKYRHLRYTEPPLNQLQRTSSNSTRSEGLNSMSSGTRQREPLLPNQAFGVSESVFIQDARDGSPITNPNPLHSQLLDMKSRLHQIEKKMSTLRAKKLESNEYTSELISSAGVLNHSADNEPGTISITNQAIGSTCHHRPHESMNYLSLSRGYTDMYCTKQWCFTVLHDFVATKEALSLHFAKM